MSIRAVEVTACGWGLQKEAQIGEDNAFYYDEETKQWRERGVAAPPPAPEPLAPPPMTSYMEPASGAATGTPPLPGIYLLLCMLFMIRFAYLRG